MNIQIQEVFKILTVFKRSNFFSFEYEGGFISKKNVGSYYYPLKNITVLFLLIFSLEFLVVVIFLINSIKGALIVLFSVFSFIYFIVLLLKNVGGL